MVEGGDWLEIGRATYSAYPGFGEGWQQGVMNVALLGKAADAAQAVYERASTLPQAMRFPAYVSMLRHGFAFAIAPVSLRCLTSSVLLW